MARIGPADRALIRSYVGAGEPSDSDLGDILKRHGGEPYAAALEVVRTRRASLLATPAQWSANGDYSENWTATIRALEGTIRELVPLAQAAAASGLGDADPNADAGHIAATAALPTLAPSRMVRCDRDDRP